MRESTRKGIIATWVFAPTVLINRLVLDDHVPPLPCCYADSARTRSSSFTRSNMDGSYFDYGQPARSYAPLATGYGPLMQPYYNTEYLVSPGMYLSAQDTRTPAAYAPLPLYGTAHTISNGGNVQDFSEPQRLSSPSVHLGNSVFPRSPAVSARNRATSDAGDSALISYIQSPSQHSALVPYTAQPSALSTVPSGTNGIRGSAQRHNAIAPMEELFRNDLQEP
ncbi:hypothetical protein IW261DRAFT_1596760 [Armillaria novae-zelandiae]|uniref:Uncharacterized protein n=1 Tax=Armillaria novae-zelandiae TaxID=153914 RepID=A0AA39T910_9AGAR|nr:hypothetical protein IW261DRAFT_1596760 [Armillaria novae-zelandiae]